MGVLALPVVGVGQDVDVTPFAAYRFGGSMSVERGQLQLLPSVAYGVTLDYRARRGTRVQVVFAQQKTGVELRGGGTSPRRVFDVAVRYVQAGAIYGRPTTWSWPYLVFAAGLSNLAPTLAGAEEEWGLSGSAGAGVVWPPTGSVAARVEARMWVTSVRGPEALFCQSGQGCYVSVGGPLLWQGQLSAGLDLSF